MAFTKRYGDTPTEKLKDRGIGSLNSGDLMVRLEACEALGRRRDRRAIPALIRALNGPDPAVADYAQHALAEIADPCVLPSLLERARQVRKRRFTSAGLLQEAAVKAAETDRSPVVDFLVDNLDAGPWTVRTNIRFALGEIGDEAAVEPLLACLETDPWTTRRAVLMALLDINDPRAEEPLERQAKRVWWRRRGFKKSVRSMAERRERDHS